MNRLRHWLARVMWRWQRRRAARLGMLFSCVGRHDDWAPVRCRRCGWRGPGRWCKHGYEDDGTHQDVVPVDYCPSCGGSEVW